MVEAVVIVGTGILQTYMIRTAQSLGLAVIATDANPAAPGAALADEFFPLDTYDIEGHKLLGRMLADHHHWHVLGVVTCGADVAPSVAACALTAGVKGIPLEIAQRTHNKFQVRRTLSAAGLDIYQPRVSHVEVAPLRAGLEARSFMEESSVWASLQQAYNIPLPWVVKPLEQRGSRGVSIVSTYHQYLGAIDKASAFGAAFLVEEQLQGSEHSAELILGHNGETLWFNIVDRLFDYGYAAPIERGHVNPTILPAHAQQQILLMILAAARTLGVAWGPFKIDCMMTKDEPKILECTARLSGGLDCQWSSPVTGRDPMRLLLQLACGMPLTIPPEMGDADGYGAVAAVFAPSSGRLRAVTIPAHIQAVMQVAVGDHLLPLEHNARRAGFVMVHDCTYESAWESAVAEAQTISASMEVDDG